ncbi:MAG: hypothetical protein H6Q00_907 [Holophagaceae bacterium]|nr:hypothetical protein [Holophagaceae bacterium]
MIDPKGGKFCVAHDCGAFGVRPGSAEDWAAPRMGVAGPLWAHPCNHPEEMP